MHVSLCFFVFFRLADCVLHYHRGPPPYPPIMYLLLPMLPSEVLLLCPLPMLPTNLLLPREM